MTPEQYRYLISELAATVQEAGGHMRRNDAERATARRLNISLSDMQGVSINAHADRVLIYDLRSESLATPSPDGNTGGGGVNGRDAG